MLRGKGGGVYWFSSIYPFQINSLPFSILLSDPLETLLFCLISTILSLTTIDNHGNSSLGSFILFRYSTKDTTAKGK